MKSIVTKAGLVNSIGTVGYLVSLLGWLLLASVVVVLLLASQLIVVPADVSVVTDPLSQPATPIVVGSYALTAIMIIVTIGILITLPYFIGKWSSRAVRRVLRLLRITDSRQAVFLTKCIIASLPMIGFLILQVTLHPDTLVFGALHISTIVTAILAILLFLVQLTLARRIKLLSADIW